jgi:hypothetical protein
MRARLIVALLLVVALIDARTGVVRDVVEACADGFGDYEIVDP